MKVQVAVCNQAGAYLPAESDALLRWIRAKFDVRFVCSDGIGFHSSEKHLVDSLCSECTRFNIPHTRTSDWVVLVALKGRFAPFGIWIA